MSRPRKGWWGVRKGASRLAFLAVVLVVTSGMSCSGGLFTGAPAPTAEQLAVYQDLQQQAVVKGAAVAPAERYLAAVRDMNVLMGSMGSSPAEKQVALTLEAILNQAEEARAELMLATRVVPPQPARAAQAREDMTGLTIVMEGILRKAANLRTGG